eukprot:6200942-Pleurochrysis_carterae.AAC.3
MADQEERVLALESSARQRANLESRRRNVAATDLIRREKKWLRMLGECKASEKLRGEQEWQQSARVKRPLQVARLSGASAKETT